MGCCSYYCCCVSPCVCHGAVWRNENASSRVNCAALWTGLTEVVGVANYLFMLEVHYDRLLARQTHHARLDARREGIHDNTPRTRLSLGCRAEPVSTTPLFSIGINEQSGITEQTTIELHDEESAKKDTHNTSLDTNARATRGNMCARTMILERRCPG